MPTHDFLADALLRLEQRIHADAYRGYDPYDALTSPLFKLPILRQQKTLRWGAQQVLKRLPINVRPLLFIPKGYNPVTLGLALHAYTLLKDVFPQKAPFYDERSAFCLSELERLQSKGYSGACWGYDFDWEARYARIPAYTPTVVATGFITNALFEYYRRTKNLQALTLCKSATQFVLNDLQRTWFDGMFCFSYSPLDRQVVLNATLKGARLLAQVYSVTKQAQLLEEAKKTVAFVVSKQQSSGAWSYSQGDARTWADNFHTGYVLDCLDEVIKCSGENTFSACLQKGFAYYEANFFVEDIDGLMPKYYDYALYPIDATAGAQSILTLTRFGKLKSALKVATWLCKHLQRTDGHFAYQKHRYYLNAIPYMRWSSAWMYLALAFLLQAQAHQHGD
ncbi:MAG: delta-aminolevulinic acid dehydratase [[Chlorobium] sp. 445]|nr:MAG: delta-aminolevulinic acid dehydratase [[Chlorobium] sp. 445]